MLHWDSGPLHWPKFRAIFVEDEDLEGSSNAQLRARFRKMRDGDGGERLPRGIRTNCLLVADQAVIESEVAKAPYIVRYRVNMPPSVDILPEDPVVYIRAVDPDYEDEEGGKKAANPAEPETSEEAGPASTSLSRREAERKSEMVGCTGEATVALPHIFDWLHYVCFNAERRTGQTDFTLRTGWHAIYVQTRVPDAWNRNLVSNSGSVHYADVPQATL